MAADWTLKVEDFGRIAAAEVTVKPLTVLVGRNNSGKSYLASLIWGTELGGWRDFVAPDATLDALAREWVGRAQAADGKTASLAPDERAVFEAAWYRYVTRNLGAFGDRLFGSDIQPASLSIIVPSWEQWLTIEPSKTLFGINLDNPFVFLSYDAPQVTKRRSTGFAVPIKRADWPLGEFLLCFIAGHGERLGFFSDYLRDSPIFLPASRTGFSLFLPTYIQSSLAEQHQRVMQPERGTHRLTFPQLHLLSALAAGFGGIEGPFAAEAARLERECLDGTIEILAPFGVANFRFKPDSCADSIGLQHSSALVTELMPLIVALRYAQDIPFLVLEEPEAHLHPKLQRVVTRCLARLVRRGVRVLITTHSETVAQQINNLIKLESLDPEQRQRFGYDADEHLAVDEVSVHEFVFREDGRTVVETVQPGPGGFGMATFNEPLLQFAQETLALNALLEGKGSEEPG